MDWVQWIDVHEEYEAKIPRDCNWRVNEVQLKSTKINNNQEFHSVDWWYLEHKRFIIFEDDITSAGVEIASI